MFEERSFRGHRCFRLRSRLDDRECRLPMTGDVHHLFDLSHPNPGDVWDLSEVVVGLPAAGRPFVTRAKQNVALLQVSPCCSTVL